MLNQAFHSGCTAQAQNRYSNATTIVVAGRDNLAIRLYGNGIGLGISNGEGGNNSPGITKASIKCAVLLIASESKLAGHPADNQTRCDKLAVRL